LGIRLVYRGLLGSILSIVDLNADIRAGSDWAPVKPQLMCGGLLAPLTATSVQMRLYVPAGSGGTYRIDDVYIDPWVHV
jgi:hypothetical protein